ncbi:hypothetical protein [Devosia sp. Root635]|uniref:hypothetical protein n=1 Tax=Devosia sp. Root635 TaxID=1736575 RepID=UPI0012E3CE5D|nr:hypothetical protein [Devosia sp. Root635]
MSELFHPNQWSDGKEPADMLLRVGRVLIWFQMYRGRESFEGAVEHNLAQARDRISEWHRRSIKGANDHRLFDIAYGDIEDLLVVSVVDGPHAACATHPRDIIAEPKVAGVITITGEVLGHLAALGGGPRELAFMANFLIDCPGTLPGAALVSALDGRRSLADLNYNLIIDGLDEPKPWTLSTGRKVSTYEFVRRSMIGMRLDPEGPTDTFSELDWFDMGYLAHWATVFTFKIRSVKLGAEGVRYAKVNRMGPGLMFSVAIAAHTGILLENQPAILEELQKNAVNFSYMIALDGGTLISMAALGSLPAIRPLQADLQKLRALS